VKVQLRILAAQPAAGGFGLRPTRPGTPLASRVALALAR
jgi:hypothetical protein